REEEEAGQDRGDEARTHLRDDVAEEGGRAEGGELDDLRPVEPSGRGVAAEDGVEGRLELLPRGESLLQVVAPLGLDQVALQAIQLPEVEGERPLERCRRLDG